MPVNEVAENILATIGTVLWTAQLVPQVVKSYREKSTEGLSPWLMFIWALSAWFLGVYAIVQNISIPIILQPQLFGALAALSWIQCLYYGSKKSRLFCASLYMAFLVAMAGFEVGLSLVIRASVIYLCAGRAILHSPTFLLTSGRIERGTSGLPASWGL
ncbi:hypothetical protein ACGC1H_003742 [Rhizoctonia solani]